MKKNFIFPFICQEEIKKGKNVILVESIGDALSLIEIGIKNVLVLFGVSMSQEIIKNLYCND